MQGEPFMTENCWHANMAAEKQVTEKHERWSLSLAPHIDGMLSVR